MKHWRSALEQIYEHNAIKIPSTYVAQTDTEKALQDALKQLELQCKERIDLLEALRVSRQGEDEDMGSYKAHRSYASSSMQASPNPNTPTRGAIGQGTIPAVSYSDLSRPALPPRPPFPERPVGAEDRLRAPSPIPRSTSSNVLYDSVTLDRGAATSSAPPPSYSPRIPTRPERVERSASPEKRAMRTTLRSGRSGDKPKSSRKGAKPAAEGPSKAATKAWANVGSRERLVKVPSDSPSTSNNLNLATPQERVRNASSSRQMQWDSHSRRLVAQRDAEITNGTTFASGRHSDEYAYTSKPSYLSISAASNALSQTSLQDVPSGSVSDNSPPKRKPLNRDPNAADDSGEGPDRRHASNAPRRRNPAPRNTTGGLLGTQETANRSRPRSKPIRPASDSSYSDKERRTPKATKRKTPARRSEDVEDSETDDNSTQSDDTPEPENKAWERKKASILKNLPPGVDESAAKQILNDVIIQGDEVRWGDIAGLEIAKNALRETVVYPFLRPDLFSGLREPARGMLLFGPPGTGKTMLARAVATESRSTFFSISASSLTSKFLGESEKLVRALFGLARTLAPSIIFVDEIDSLLSQRSGSGEHEATRRIKTEFLIQWSDLQRASAGREVTERDKERGDANRVLVLAATNLPWAIDEAARRRFVRRQYIPLPEHATRETQLRTLLGQQKHNLSDADITQLVDLTDGKQGYL